MTTTNGGPESVMSQYPSFRGEASANEAFMDFQSGNSDATKVAQPIQQVTQASHDISAREIVVITQTDRIKQSLGFNQPGALLYGKPPVIAQSGNFPHGLSDAFMESDYFKSLSAEQQFTLKVQKTLKLVKPYGVSNANFNKTPGAAKSPNQDGIDVVVWGPSTVRLFTGKILPPMTEVRLAMIPQQVQGRSGNVRYQSEGAERFPWTVAEVNNKPLEEVIRADIYEFGRRLFGSDNRGATVTKAASIFARMVTPKTSSSDPYLESEKDAATIIAGMLGGAAIVIEELILAGVLTFNAPAPAAAAGGGGGGGGGAAAQAMPAAATTATTANSLLWAGAVPGLFLLEQSPTAAAAAAQSQHQKLMMSIIARFASHQTQTSTGKPAIYNILTRNSTNSVVTGVQDAAASYTSTFGKILQQIPSASTAAFKQSASGSYVYDILVTHRK